MASFWTLERFWPNPLSTNMAKQHGVSLRRFSRITFFSSLLSRSLFTMLAALAVAAPVTDIVELVSQLVKK